MMANTNSSKRGLGKGLGALIPQGSVFVGGRTIVNVDINNVVPNPRQPRTRFSKESLHELSESIKTQGVIEPILTRMRDGKYELVAGERRLRAAKLAGIAAIPAIVKDFTDQQSLELSLIENLQREDLNPMDEAEGYARLTSEFSLTQEAVSKRVGKDRSTVTNMIRLLSLPKQVKESLRKGEITVGHARPLLALDAADKQIHFWHEIVKGGLNVRDAEILVTGKEEKSKVKKGGRKRAFTQNVELNALVEQLTEHLATKVKVHGSPDRGRIEIEYYSKEDLERVLELITGGKIKREVTASIAPVIIHSATETLPPPTAYSAQ
ncbi:MAG: ParB/RepB/Spo0J family partition protein [Candidatus Margulisbacteria bacterium]|nr:ParB/RepB/Spo0J family partition protein [Candidatus Margulisiibacteriota bacterium]